MEDGTVALVGEQASWWRFDLGMKPTFDGRSRLGILVIFGIFRGRHRVDAFAAGHELVDRLRPQPLLLDLGNLIDAVVGPAAVGVLSGEQSHSEKLDARTVVRVAEAIEEEQTQGKLIGSVFGVRGIAHRGVDRLDRRIVLGLAAFEQRKSGERRRADSFLTGLDALHIAELFFEIVRALLDCCIDGLLIGRKRGRVERETTEGDEEK